MLRTVYLAAEDVPGLAVGRKLVAEWPELDIYREENAGGWPNLKSKTPNYDKMGKCGLPVLMLTDLDADPCPSGKVANWLGRTPSQGFLFRICVREIEAWLLADRDAMAGFLEVPCAKLPSAPESLPDPKAKLIQLARKAPRKIRLGLTPLGLSTIGPNYNDLLSDFV
ncbi:MAG: hypothetical protein KF791_08810, partial [Verrucomicrobiae bacterium]|nr:hypothetical protein [Verrucomicrobiae bacterium]